MKPTTLFSTLLCVAAAHALRYRHSHPPHDILARGVNPSVDATRASVANILATAVPSSALDSLTSKPTHTLAPGEVMPSWYQALPSDVKSLLPSLYPLSSTCSPKTTTKTITLTRVPTWATTGAASTTGPAAIETGAGDKTSCTTTTTSTTTMTRTAKMTGSAPAATQTSCTTTTITTTMTKTYTVGQSQTPVVTPPITLTSAASDSASATFPPFPIFNATVPAWPTTGTDALGSGAVPSQTSGAPPPEFTSGAAGRMVGSGLSGLIAVVVAVGLWFGL